MVTVTTSDTNVIDVNDSFYLTNNSESPLSLRWNRVTYFIKPGETKPVPFDVIRLYFGDPRSSTSDARFTDPHSQQEGIIPSRDKELYRLSTLYGLYADKTDDLPAVVPSVTVTTLVDDVEILCPANYPNADPYAHIEDDKDVHDVAQLIRRLERQQAEQNERLESLYAFKDEVMSEDIPVDSPPELG